jgi:hypothetical protein
LSESGQRRQALFNHPLGLEIINQTLYVADTENDCIRSINLASGVSYDAKSQNLFLKNPMVNTIKFQNQSLMKNLPDGIQNAIGTIIAETIAKKPIYNLKKTSSVSGLVKGIDVRNGQIFVTFGL